LPEVACFHAQQCIEKYAKAFLQEKGVEFERTHNMVYLSAQCTGADSEFKDYQPKFMALDEYSVGIRYPGGSVSEADARDALAAMTELRAFIRLKLGLESTI
jgi:HEPN domain-containing protein